MELHPALEWLIAAAAAVGSVLLVMLVVNVVVNRICDRLPILRRPWLRVRRPLLVLLLSIALRISFATAAEPSTFRDVGMHVLLIAVIVTGVWLGARIVLAWLGHTQERVVTRKTDDRDRRRTRTQMLLVRRLVNVAFIILGLAMVLLTFPGVEQVGTTILASAGLLSVVIGIAAQSSLGNVFAGLQLAFTDAIRIGDIVEVDGTYGTIEDITLSYVVVAMWTEQHKVLPSTHFTTVPFINWSRTGDTITGIVLFELDWRVDIERMRAEFDRILDGNPLWDGRSSSLLMTDSIADRVTVRAVVSSANTGDNWNLRCEVREKLVAWLRDNDPAGLPSQRLVVDPDEPIPPHLVPATDRPTQ